MVTGGSGPARQVGGFDAAGRAFVAGAFGGGGLVLGIVLPWLARLVRDLPWAPFRGPLSLLASFDDGWLVWGRPLVGLVLGLGFAAWVVFDSAVLEVDPAEVRVRRRGSVQRVLPRETVDGVHRDGAKVVIEAPGGRVLFRDDVEGDRSAVRAAFVEAGYPWEGPPD